MDATTTPYLMNIDTGIMLLFFSVIILTFLIFVLYIIYPIKGNDNIIN